jgi:GTP-binding protein
MFKAEEGDRAVERHDWPVQDLVIPVPPGTLVYDVTSGELIGDLVESGERLVVCPGGRGGGNPFRHPRNQAPRRRTGNRPGTGIELELRLVADIGIIGAPNAGKSTLLAALTNAQPKIAPILSPPWNLTWGSPGWMMTPAWAGGHPRVDRRTHQGLVWGMPSCVTSSTAPDPPAGWHCRDPLLDYAQINSELALFDPDLGQKPQIVAVNKIDLPEVQERWPRLKAELSERLGKNGPPLAVSALARTRLDELLRKAAQLLAQAPPPPVPAEVPVYRAESDPRAFDIQHEANGWGFRTGDRTGGFHDVLGI